MIKQNEQKIRKVLVGQTLLINFSALLVVVAGKRNEIEEGAETLLGDLPEINHIRTVVHSELIEDFVAILLHQPLLVVKNVRPVKIEPNVEGIINKHHAAVRVVVKIQSCVLNVIKHVFKR